MGDRQRVWCLRAAEGTLLAPGVMPAAPAGRRSRGIRIRAGGHRQPGRTGRNPDRSRLALNGSRCGRVRRPPRPQRRPLGPTPATGVCRAGACTRRAASTPPRARSTPKHVAVRRPRWCEPTLVTTMAILGFAALMHVVRYALLLVNRTVLLSAVVAAVVTWGEWWPACWRCSRCMATAVVLTNWLIARRAAVFAHNGRPELRSKLAVVGRLSGPGGQSVLGAGLSDRVGPRRRPQQTADRALVDRVGVQHRGLGVVDRDQLHQRCAGHRATAR